MRRRQSMGDPSGRGYKVEGLQPMSPPVYFPS